MGNVSAMGETIRIDAPAGEAEAYLTHRSGTDPGVLFYMDAIGLRPRLEEMADRIASWGYVVLVPNVFYRDGTAAELAPTTDLRVRANRGAFFAGGVRGRIARYTPDLSGSDSDAWVATLADAAGPGPIGVTGYCMGARLAVRTAARFPDRVAAVGGWHGGGLVTDDPDSPHRLVGSATAEFAFGHADRDGSMPAEAVEILGAALHEAGRSFTNEIFPGAEHGYTMADTSSYDEAAAERHFETLRALLDRRLR